MAAMLTSVMSDSDRVGYFIEECRKHGIRILPPDINRSGLSFSVEANAIRFGLAGVKNVGEGAIDSILKGRADGILNPWSISANGLICGWSINGS